MTSSNPFSSSPAATRLSALTTSTLSLLLERQRTLSLSLPTSATNTRTIGRNLNTLASGIQKLSEEQNRIEQGDAVRPAEVKEKEDELIGLQKGLERLTGILEEDEEGKRMVDELRKNYPSLQSVASRPTASNDDTNSTGELSSTSQRKSAWSAPIADQPYRYDDEEGAEEGGKGGLRNDEMVQMQRDMMNEQDNQLDSLSVSINRQRDISLQMNEELELHSNLLGEMDSDVERTGLKLGRASGRLKAVEQGLRDHGSTCTIIFLVIILLILLIAVFK